MTLLLLPEEIIIKILKYVDFKTLCNLYNTCSYLRNLSVLRNVVKKCQFSLNTLATAETLKVEVFREIASHLKVLDLKGVQNLNRTNFLQGVRKCKELEELDISFTLLNIIDLLDLSESCTSLKKVAINFYFGVKHRIHLPNSVLIQCQKMFKKFEMVHLVLNIFNLYSELPLYILQESNLKKLKFTATECNLPVYKNQLCEKLFGFTEFHVYSLNHLYSINRPIDLNKISFFSKIDLKNSEYCIISALSYNFVNVVASVGLKDFFKKTFNIDTISISQELQQNFVDQSFVVMVWDKKKAHFDDSFFTNLAQKLRQILPFKCELGDKQLQPYDGFYLTEVQVKLKNETPEPSLFKKKRIAPKNFELNFASLFPCNDNIKLVVNFEGHNENPYSLTPDCSYLRKITFLSLNNFHNCTANFYETIFDCCINLKTFVCTHLKNNLALLTSLKKSNSLKNICLQGISFNFETMFRYLSQCSTLENILIRDHSSLPIEITDPHELIKISSNLYSLQINAYYKDAVQTKSMILANKAKIQYNKAYINIIFRIIWCYDPFIDVFCLNPIKHI